MLGNFEKCVTYVFKYEGGYSNNPSDPGGPTNWGITIADARKYWKSDATAVDVKNMPKSVAYDIYKSKYWKTDYYDCDKLAPGVDLCVFDFGVNSGPARAKKYLVASIGGTDEETINNICEKRLAFLKGLKTWPTFGKGWEARVRDVQTKALDMARDERLPKDTSAKPIAPEAAAPAAIFAVLAGYFAFVNDHMWEALAIGGGTALLLWLGIKLFKRYKQGKK